jgi:PKD repeat protein
MQPFIYSKYIPALVVFHLSGLVSFGQLKADFTADQTGGCSPLAVSFTNKTTGASANVKYKWDFANGNTSTLVNAGATFFDEKKYTVTLTATDGAQTSEKKMDVTVYKKPTIAFSLSPVRGCMPLSVTFTSSSSAGDGTVSNYFWDFGDGSTSQGLGLKETNHTYTFVQNPNISLTVTNSYGCYNTLEKPKTIEVLASIKANFTADKTVLCKEGESVSFTNTSTGPGTLSYEWDFGDGKTSTDKNPTHSYEKKGMFTVKLTVKSSGGCTEVYEQKDMINVANYTVDFDVPALICENTNTFFSNTSTSGSNNSVWNIDGHNYYYNYSGINHVFNDPGQHTIKLTQTYGDCDAAKTKTIDVKTAPKLNGFVAEFGSLCGVPVTIQFKDTSKDAVKCHGILIITAPIQLQRFKTRLILMKWKVRIMYVLPLPMPRVVLPPQNNTII